MAANLDRLEQIALYQRETGCRVEYEPSAILELIAVAMRMEFAREHLLGRVWTDAEIDAAIAARKAKGFD